MEPVQRFRADLTPRELEILECIAQGDSAKEAAHKLNIAPRTVERHLENTRLKMGARNRVHLVTRSIVAGVLDLGLGDDVGKQCENCLFHPKNSVSEVQGAGI